MGETVLTNEALIRLVVFMAVLAAMALWEVASPRRARALPRLMRWSNHFALLVIDALALRLLFPILAVGAALWAQSAGWGVLNMLNVPVWLAIIISLVAMDFAIYWQHRLTHAVPLLWRMHRLHHGDTEIDVTTAIRFHPLEIVLSMVLKIALVIGLGAPAVGGILFELLLNGLAMFNHANIRLPHALDRALRRFIVTPDMHLVHHSVHREETDSNFGFGLSVWDRLFGTYRDQPRDGVEKMTIGLEAFRSNRDRRLDQLLLQPFRRAPD